MIPPLTFDYSGFPKAAYENKYPAPGALELANKVFKLLISAGIAAKLDNQRDFDHDLLLPLKLMYPQANIPCIQLFLVNSLRPQQHIQIDKALASLRNDHVMIIGLGFTFHNVSAFFAATIIESPLMNAALSND